MIDIIILLEIFVVKSNDELLLFCDFLFALFYIFF